MQPIGPPQAVPSVHSQALAAVVADAHLAATVQAQAQTVQPAEPAAGAVLDLSPAAQDLLADR